MRTTIRLDDQLLKEAKKAAAESGQTFTQLVSDALRERLARRRQARGEKRFRVYTVRGMGVRPGVDLSNNAAMFDLMDEEDAAP